MSVSGEAHDDAQQAFLGTGDQTKEELDVLEGEVLERKRAAEQKNWKNALFVFLNEHPEAKAELAALIEEAKPGGVTITASAHDQANQAVLGSGTQTNTFGRG